MKKTILFLILKAIEIPLLIFVPYWAGLGCDRFGLAVPPSAVGIWLCGILGMLAFFIIGVFAVMGLYCLIRFNWILAEKMIRR